MTSDSNSVLRIEGLTKKYGKLTAVDKLDLTIDKGQIYGILGPNGSGKTTTLGMILEILAPSAGSFSWFGGMNEVESRKKIGSILETPCFYSYLSAVQNLRITAHIKECHNSRIEEVLAQVNLLDRKDDDFKTFSLGMKQRLSIAAALLADPPVLILDEPTNGLDPQGIAEIRSLIRQIADEGKTIIMASHLLDEVQKVCTHFCVLRKGQKLHEGTVSDILGETKKIRVSTKQEGLKELLGGSEMIKEVSSSGTDTMITLDERFSSQDINRYCFENGITISEIQIIKNSLEQELLKILEEN